MLHDPPTVLVAAASRHGSTNAIAQTIGRTLAERGLRVEIRRMADVDTVFPYDAFVLGSAVYFGSWLRDAQQFLDEHLHVIATRPTWLFSSGPTGAPGADTGDAFDPAALLAMTQARGHRLFAGAIRRADLGPNERLLARVLHVPEGDRRDWADVADWSNSVAGLLSCEHASPR
jgi:menaquinone-dependent protoporphyrinogen oxidase